MLLRQIASLVVVVVPLGLGLASCSSGPTSTATALCKLEAPLSPHTDVALINLQSVKNGEHSGDAGLDRAATDLLRALQQHSEIAVTAAGAQLESACQRLGIPVG